MNKKILEEKEGKVCCSEKKGKKERDKNRNGKAEKKNGKN